MEKFDRKKCIALVAPGGLASQARFEAGLSALCEAGLRPKIFEPVAWPEDVGESCQASSSETSTIGSCEIVSSDCQISASDRETCSWNPTSAKERARILQTAFLDKDVGAILAVRGGYGCAELLPHLDFKVLADNQKPLMGYSDISALLLPLADKAGVKGIHGALLAEEFALSSLDGSSTHQRSLDSLLEALENPNYQPNIDLERLSLGGGSEKTVIGEIYPSNLTLLQSLLATPWQVDLSGRILFIEEVGEPAYKIHRCLQQLKLSGCLDDLAALVVGRLSIRPDEEGEIKEVPRNQLDFLLESLFAEAKYPIFKSAGFGHYGLNVALPVGARASIEDESITLV